MIKAIVYNISLMLNLVKFMFLLIIKLILLPFKMIGLLVNNVDIPIKRKRIFYKKSSFDRETDLYKLSSDELKMAYEEGMSPSDFIEAEERDDDNLDTDD